MFIFNKNTFIHYQQSILIISTYQKPLKLYCNEIHLAYTPHKTYCTCDSQIPWNGPMSACRFRKCLPCILQRLIPRTPASLFSNESSLSGPTFAANLWSDWLNKSLMLSFQSPNQYMRLTLLRSPLLAVCFAWLAEQLTSQVIPWCFAPSSQTLGIHRSLTLYTWQLSTPIRSITPIVPCLQHTPPCHCGWTRPVIPWYSRVAGPLTRKERERR